MNAADTPHPPFSATSSVRRRLCLATDSREPSGVGEHMLVLAAELRHDFDIALACPSSSGGDRLLDRAAQIGIRPHMLGSEDGTRDWLRDQHLDVLHVHAGVGWEGLRLGALGREAGVPVLVRTEHLPDVITDPGQRHAHTDGTAQVDRVICVSEASARSHAAAGMDPAKIIVIRNGLPDRPALRARATVRQEFGIDGSQPVAITPARFTAQKDHASLIEAMPRTLDRIPGLRFLFAGDGPLLEECRHRAEALGAARSVMFLGQRTDVPDLLAAADLFILPSRFEGLPLAVIEAMAASLPVLSTRVGGTDEVVIDGVTGLLVPPGDPDAMGNGIVELLADRVWARELGRAGRARFDGDFTAAHMADRTASLYRSLIA